MNNTKNQEHNVRVAKTSNDKCRGRGWGMNGTTINLLFTYYFVIYMSRKISKVFNNPILIL